MGLVNYLEELMKLGWEVDRRCWEDARVQPWQAVCRKGEKTLVTFGSTIQEACERAWEQIRSLGST